MVKGQNILYVCTTFYKNLVKIGSTTEDNFNKRMWYLEQNGYKEVVGIRRAFAIKIDNADELETLLKRIMTKIRFDNSELYEMNIQDAVKLFKSFNGEIFFDVIDSIIQIEAKTVDNDNDNHRKVLNLPQQLDNYN